MGRREIGKKGKKVYGIGYRWVWINSIKTGNPKPETRNSKRQT
jgi:hypothetical protein